MKRLALLIFMLFASASHAYAPFWKPSFDCRKAKSDVEHMICKSSYLSSYDRYLATLYKRSLKYFESEKKEELRFINERNECGSWDCVRERYEARVSELLMKLSDASLIPANAIDPKYINKIFEDELSKTSNNVPFILRNGFNTTSSESEYEAFHASWSILGFAIDSNNFASAEIYVYLNNKNSDHLIKYDDDHPGNFYGITLKLEFGNEDYRHEPMLMDYKITATSGAFFLNREGFPRDTRFKLATSKLEVCSGDVIGKTKFHGDIYPANLSQETANEALRKLGAGNAKPAEVNGTYALIDIYNEGLKSPITFISAWSSSAHGCSVGVYLELNDSLDGFVGSKFNDYVMNNTSCDNEFVPVEINGITYILQLTRSVITGIFSLRNQQLYEICK